MNGLERLEGATQRRDGAAVHVGVLHHRAVVRRHRRANRGAIRTDHHHSALDVEGFQRFENAHDEGPSAEVQQGFGSAHPGRAAAREDYGGERHGATRIRPALGGGQTIQDKTPP